MAVYAQKTQELLGHTDNFSSNGLTLISNRPIPTKTVLQIYLKVPMLEAIENISLDAFPAWTSISDSRPVFYYTGFYFLSPKEEESKHIELLIDMLQLHSDS